MNFLNQGYVGVARLRHKSSLHWLVLHNCQKIFSHHRKTHSKMVTEREVYELLGMSLDLIRPYTIRDVMLFLENRLDLFEAIDNLLKVQKAMKRLYALQSVYNQNKAMKFQITDEVMEKLVRDLEVQKRAIYMKRQKILNTIFQNFLK